MTSLIDEDLEISESFQKEVVDMKQQGRVRADSKGRVSLGRYLGNSLPKDLGVVVREDGSITLIPLKTIPESELWLYKNPEVYADLKQAIEEVGKGKVKSRGSFAKYVKDEI